MSNQDYYAEEALKTIKKRMHRDQVMISALKSIERKKQKTARTSRSYPKTSLKVLSSLTHTVRERKNFTTTPTMQRLDT